MAMDIKKRKLAIAVCVGAMVGLMVYTAVWLGGASERSSPSDGPAERGHEVSHAQRLPMDSLEYAERAEAARPSGVNHDSKVGVTEPEPIPEADVRAFRRALGAPHSFDWTSLVDTRVLNPSAVEVSAELRAAIKAVADAEKPQLRALRDEADRVAGEELADLHAQGLATVVNAGESPLGKLGAGAVYRGGVGGKGLAAAAEQMPRHREVRLRQRKAGERMVLKVASVVRDAKVMPEARMAFVDQFLRE